MFTLLSSISIVLFFWNPRNFSAGLPAWPPPKKKPYAVQTASQPLAYLCLRRLEYDTDTVSNHVMVSGGFLNTPKALLRPLAGTALPQRSVLLKSGVRTVSPHATFSSIAGTCTASYRYFGISRRCTNAYWYWCYWLVKRVIFDSQSSPKGSPRVPCGICPMPSSSGSYDGI